MSSASLSRAVTRLRIRLARSLAAGAEQDLALTQIVEQGVAGLHQLRRPWMLELVRDDTE